MTSYEGFYQTLGVSFAFWQLYSFTSREPRRMRGNSWVSGSWGLWGLATNICPLGKIEYWRIDQYSTYIHAPWTSTNIWWQSISDISGCLFPIHQTWWIRTCSHTWLSGCRNLHPYLSLLWLCHHLLTPTSPRVLPGNSVRHSRAIFYNMVQDVTLYHLA